MNKRKYYMRGLGFGILITSVILMVSNSRNKLTDANAIQRVKDLGYELVRPEEKKNMNLSEMKDKLTATPDPLQSQSVTPAPSVTTAPTKTVTPLPVATPGSDNGGPTPYVYKDEKGIQRIRFNVTSDMTFEDVFDILHQNGIISDQNAFFELVDKLSGEDKLKQGTYNLVETMSEERLVKILIGAEPNEN